LANCSTAPPDAPPARIGRDGKGDAQLMGTPNRRRPEKPDGGQRRAVAFSAGGDGGRKPPEHFRAPSYVVCGTQRAQQRETGERLAGRVRLR
jgi:hypothetical protein